MQRKIIETADGSKTIHIEEWNEHYHSTHGALQEAMHVFINKVEEQIGNRKEINILEMGFGTGLNAFLTLRMALKLKIKINYTTLEAFPISEDEVQKLEYANLWPKGLEFYKVIHASKWEGYAEIHPLFSLRKKESKFENWVGEKDHFDFIYFDAFGPRVQPELWTIPIFKEMFLCAKNKAIFLTYCAKGQVRRDLERVGFNMTRLPGPPGKREMLMGKKL